MADAFKTNIAENCGLPKFKRGESGIYLIDQSLSAMSSSAGLIWMLPYPINDIDWLLSKGSWRSKRNAAAVWHPSRFIIIRFDVHGITYPGTISCAGCIGPPESITPNGHRLIDGDNRLFQKQPLYCDHQFGKAVSPNFGFNGSRNDDGVERVLGFGGSSILSPYFFYGQLKEFDGKDAKRVFVPRAYAIVESTPESEEKGLPENDKASETEGGKAQGSWKPSRGRGAAEHDTSEQEDDGHSVPNRMPISRYSPKYRYERNHWAFLPLNILLLFLIGYSGFTTFEIVQEASAVTGVTLKPAARLNPTAAQENPSVRPPLSAYQLIWSRSLFHAEKAEETSEQTEISLKDISPASENLGLVLVGTVTADDPALRCAVISNETNRLQDVYREGDKVGNVWIKSILRENVIIGTEEGDVKISVDYMQGPRKSFSQKPNDEEGSYKKSTTSHKNRLIRRRRPPQTTEFEDEHD